MTHLHKAIGVIFLISLILSSTAEQQRKLIIVGEDWPPFEFYSNNKVVGINSSIIKEICTKHKIPYEIIFVPYIRAIHMLKTGKADVALSTSRNAKREKFLKFPEDDDAVLWTSRYTFFYNKFDGIKDIKSYQEIKDKNYTIAIVRAYSYHPDFWKYFPKNIDSQPNPNLIVVSYMDQCLKMLRSNRVDLVLTEKTVGNYMASLFNLNGLKASKKNMFEKKYYLPFSKKSTLKNIDKIQEIFQKELKLMKADGRYDEIYKQWVE